MSGWQGRSNSREIKEGVAILLLYSGYISGQPTPILSGPCDLDIEMVDRWIKTSIISANSEELILKTTDGQLWQMTPVQSHEFGSSITTSLPSEDWVVRKKL